VIIVNALKTVNQFTNGIFVTTKLQLQADLGFCENSIPAKFPWSKTIVVFGLPNNQSSYTIMTMYDESLKIYFIDHCMNDTK